MLDLYLRAEDEAAINAALLAADLIDEEGNSTSELVCLDRIGTISRVTGYVDDEPVTEELPGWHCNVRLLFDPTPEQLGDLDAVTIDAPGQPYRVWAD